VLLVASEATVYYAVLDSDGGHIATVEADFAGEAVATVEASAEHEGETLHAREANRAEVFRHLVDVLGLSYRDLGDELDVSKDYISHRLQGIRDIRRMDVLALERLRELREREE
jgi:DNA-directed RNA polymerase specialized sigma24 family protein